MARRLFLMTLERGPPTAPVDVRQVALSEVAAPRQSASHSGRKGQSIGSQKSHAPHQQRFSPRTTPRRATNTGTRWVTQFKHPRRGGVYSSRCHA